MTKVKSIYVNNLMAIDTVKLDLNGCSALVVAGNGKGKSTACSLLINRLQGMKPEKILKQGEKEGVYRMELTDGARFEWEVNDTTKKGANIAEIKFFTAEGIKSPVTTLIATTYFPSLFDVDTFLSDTPQKQQMQLQQLGGIDFTEIDKRKKEAFDKRTDLNRDVKNAQAKLKPVDKSLPAKEADILEIQKEVAGIDTHNQKVTYVKSQLDEKKISLEAKKQKLAELEAEISGLNKDITAGEIWINQPENKLKDEAATKALNDKLTKAVEDNKKIVENNTAIQLKKEFDEITAKADAADKEVKKIEKEKADLIKTAKLPKEFGFDDEGGITYNGLPFVKGQQGLAERYIAALKLAFLGLGKVKMIHFDASPLDNINLKEVQDWALENDLQILIEMPDREGGEIQYTLIEQ